jgi:hypothetical protein
LAFFFGPIWCVVGPSEHRYRPQRFRVTAQTTSQPYIGLELGRNKITSKKGLAHTLGASCIDSGAPQPTAPVHRGLVPLPTPRDTEALEVLGASRG